MECKVSELVKRGHDQDAELKSSCGAVDVREVAQLISDMATQLDAQLARSNVLAAENAGLKSVVAENWNLRDVLRQLIAGRQGGCYFIKWEPLIFKALNETPVTDAFLAEVRASAVEEFVRMADYSESVADGEVIVTSSSVFAAGHEFAAQIRKGVQS